ncbi:DGQHR domain-containing protein [Acinetobacter baumannii]|uniref:DGQHR domain-containing protein n=2 Tax=Acinetobacter baumannii TaxID=470 RepID=UPI0002CF8A50|nr:DGQHR domain-containing protein [Acinetobacter baumannii]EHU1617387.1 DGQHR domain-containing protein [Acinetobacter baumannii]EKT9292226.1 DGQHR domain-containing protein [Acinetobacter baumannii]EKV4016738.1 DGQHR domain-containing protein [Acinetobacter baumannii]EKV7456164.1 DGQHR domain-containing protein [Acinetobacter baumannii]EKW1353811.1 DGQHR domain-containing protein [Acinetobacter baumannii]
MIFPITVPAIKISQPMSDFYAVSLPAYILLEVCFSDIMRAKKTEAGYILEGGTQRSIQQERLKKIAEYIERDDSAFPNSIILAANYHESGYTIEELEDQNDLQTNESLSWEINKINIDNPKCKLYTLTIPSAKKLAAIIDGQHRLFGFTKEYLKDSEKLNMDLLCSVYLDLPKGYQADLFSIINTTQKPVDKSLSYELYGYNISEEDSNSWTPDKLSIFLTRKLASLPGSPLLGRIRIAAKADEELVKIGQNSDWKVSTAVVVEGIMRLISTNPTKDANYLIKSNSKTREDLIFSNRKDLSPLREFYLKGNDNFIYTLVFNYLTACNELFWINASSNSFIIRTVGIQALFDILKKIIPESLRLKKISKDFFFEKLLPAQSISFDDSKFINASGSGRREIRNAIEIAIGLKEKPE